MDERIDLGARGRERVAVMIPKHLIGVRVYSPTASRDAHGNAVAGYAPAQTRYVFAIAPRENDEPVPGRDESVETLTVYAPPGFTLDHRDRVEWRDKVYEVVSEVKDYTFVPFDFEPGVNFVLERVEG